MVEPDWHRWQHKTAHASACWIIKAIDTHSEYVILNAFPLQHWLHERASVLCYTYFGCLVILYIQLMNIGFGGLGVACWPLVPKFAGSNPGEAVGFLG